jgi:cytidylate kinase
VPTVAAVPGVRKWMKIKQRDCARFGNLVMEGRDIGSNIFPETDFKYYLNASLDERAKRRAADGVDENLAERDKRDSQRAAAPLMIALGARVIDTSTRRLSAAVFTAPSIISPGRTFFPTGFLARS